LVFIVAWFKLFKPLSIDKTKAGLSREALIGEVGQIISTPTSEKNGIVRFPVPLLGANEWEVISQEELTVGDRVKVTEVSGNSLIVARA
jgi:membrane-bound ClpP family serine protease